MDEKIENTNLASAIEQLQQTDASEFKEATEFTDSGKLSLKYFLEKCLTFEMDPSEENSRVIESFLSKVQVKKYLPVIDKIVNVGKMSKIESNYDALGTIMYIEIGKVFDGLLAYCANIEDDAGALSRITTSCDYIYNYGLADTILSVCEKDFNIFSKMVEEMINVSNIYKLSKTTQLFSEARFGEWARQVKDIKNMLNPQTIKDLLKISAANEMGAEEKLVSQIVSDLVKEEYRQEVDVFNEATKDIDMEGPAEEEV